VSHSEIKKPMKQRIDLVLVERNLVPTRAKAQALILAGSVFVNGQKRTKAGEQIDVEAGIEVRGALPFVGRGGFKLDHALATFGLDVHDLSAIDVGACTGGFTDVLLQRGARRVYAIDVGYGQLDYSLRIDPRVVVIERTNIRQLEALPDGETADCGVVDVSFISLRLVIPELIRFLSRPAHLVALIKPQFEVGRGMVGRGGIVRDVAAREEAVAAVRRVAREAGFEVLGAVPSPIPGRDGNREFLMAGRLG